MALSRGCLFDSTLTTFNQARSSVHFCKNKDTFTFGEYFDLTVNPITNAINAVKNVLFGQPNFAFAA